MISLPAIAEVEERHEFETLRGRRTVVRKVGEALHPEREPLEVLAMIRHSLGEYNFSGQYQQSPAPLGGGLVKREWLQYYEPNALPEFDQVLQSWDTAAKETKLADYSVCTTWGVKGPHRYLLDVWRAKADFPKLKRMVEDQIA